MFFFVWVDEGTPFNPDIHSVEDEVIYSIDITQAEGDYAILTMEIENPGIGLLSPGRKQYAWLSEDGSPRFYGRLDAAPDDIHSEIITIEIVAEPVDVNAQKNVIAADLRVLPYWDAAWIQEDINNPDAVLETYTKLWHVDRITHVVSVSDILNAEDGIIEIQSDEHFYDDMVIRKSGKKPNKITIKATAKWRQKAAGEVDLTNKIWREFVETGSPFNYPVVSSFTSQGLFDDWPEPLKNLGGGWSMSANSVVALANSYIASGTYSVSYLDRSDTPPSSDTVSSEEVGKALTQWQMPTIPRIDYWDQTKWETWDISFPIIPVHQNFIVAYEADRERTEILTISLTAELQPLYHDDIISDAEEIIELNSDFIDQPVDDGEALPIGDLRRNMFFPTDRGNFSIQYFMLLMMAKLTYRSRAIIIDFETEWEQLAEVISCRKSILLHDPRLPGGQTLGKVISYSLIANETTQIARVSIGCAIGHNVALPAATSDGNIYADDYAEDWAEEENLKIDVIPGILQYTALDNTIVVDDDGVNFFDMMPDRVILSLNIVNGIETQRQLINEMIRSGVTDPDPIGIVKDNPTRPRLQLVPVTGGAFLTEYEVITSNLVIPKMIDLEAA